MQPIRKLDTQLANQIAAGEVVERPASVVKELLENSLDAGANRIDIEITSGGTGLIRIRDNGCGIPKEQLKLALSPHATSKIYSLDDLEVIQSFGFRGEALSSISSVSRFTLSSRVKDAEQGWQAEAEGREMDVALTPVAVAEGTRIDVRELFFNTPARRRFLRTEKTEFSHIEETVKKVALANFTVAITLKHNGRMSRRFRAADNIQQQEQRVAAVCGRQFMERSIRLDLDHQGIQIEGWLALPDYHRSQTDGQYFYVNNRPVKDRVLSHAIRQAYQQFIPEGRVPAYVLYLTIDPRKVDVNVHPTKHEVRFHDGRLIHDLLVQAIERGLIEGKALVDSEFLKQPTNAKHSASDNFSNKIPHSNEDQIQHQAYRSMLESVSNISTTQGITEASPSLIMVKDWRYLTHLGDEFLLLEKEQQLIKLSVPLLLNTYVNEHNQQSPNKQCKLLFPEIFTVSDLSKTQLLAEFLANFQIDCSHSVSQITIQKIPEWMESLSINVICFELITAFYNEYIGHYEHDGNSVVINIVQSPSFEERAHCLLTLLTQCSDTNKLKLQHVSKDDLLEFFNGY